MGILSSVFGKRKQIVDNNDTNPWSGLLSYEDPVQAEHAGRRPKLFCGRDEDTRHVTQLVTGNIFVTLYGRSGTGKTSLLNAGVFPLLRQKYYFPISIRLSMDAFGISFQKCIIKKITDAIPEQCRRVIEVVPLAKDEDSPDYLWSYFARTRFTDENNHVIFPVIVFDQFEEIFRSRRSEAEVLLCQIAYLMDESHALSNRQIDGVRYQYDFNFRFLASIREDDLYRLEDSIDNNYLPGLKRCRYRLQGLKKQGAREAILLPGEELFLPEEKELIADAIIRIASFKEDQSVSTNLLSLVCSRIYSEYCKSVGTGYISLSQVEEFIQGNPIERFYSEATSGISYFQKKKLEDRLVTDEGYRSFIKEKEFVSIIPDESKRQRLLDSNQKILQRISISSQHEGYGIELIHDSFCEAIYGVRRKRQRRMTRVLSGTFIVIVLTLIGLMLLLPEKGQKELSKRYFIQLKEDGSVDRFDNWEAVLTVVADSLHKEDTIDANNWQQHAVLLDLPLNCRKISVCLDYGKFQEKYYNISDSVVELDKLKNDEPISVVIRKIIPPKYLFNVKVVCATDDNQMDSLYVQDAIVIVQDQMGRTDSTGWCQFVLPEEVTPKDELIVIREGFHVASKTVGEKMLMDDDSDGTYVSLKPKVSHEEKCYERMVMCEFVDSLYQKLLDGKSLDYYQNLEITYSDGHKRKLLLRAYVESVNKGIETIKGCYYYAGKDKDRWKNVPYDKLYMLEGYIDRNQRQGREMYYSLVGTDVANNKEILSGYLYGNKQWRGTLSTPHRVGISGSY